MSRGMEDLVGQSFGERVVIAFSHKNSSRNSCWVVRCSCGNEGVVPGTQLKLGKANQCKECSSRVNGRKGLYSQAQGKPVYFIGCGDYFKIGSSDNIERRMKDMQTNNPYEVILLGVDEDEEMWHRTFAHRHHRGEWYHRGHCELVDIGGN